MDKLVKLAEHTYGLHIYMRMSINDEKYEIAESHIYNTQINAVGRVGDKLVLLTPEKAYQSPISDPHLSLSSFTAIEEITGAKFLMPLTDNMFGFANPKLKKATFDNEGKVLVEELRNTDANDVHEFTVTVRGTTDDCGHLYIGYKLMSAKDYDWFPANNGNSFTFRLNYGNY